MKKILYLLCALVLSVASLGVIGCNPPQKDAVNLKYYADASQIAPLILGGSETIGLIPEPAATDIKRMISFEVLDQTQTEKKSNKTK